MMDIVREKLKLLPENPGVYIMKDAAGKIIYVGNFTPRHSTETHVARALESNGHEVVRVQESERANWFDLGEIGWLRSQGIA